MKMIVSLTLDADDWDTLPQHHRDQLDEWLKLHELDRATHLITDAMFWSHNAVVNYAQPDPDASDEIITAQALGPPPAFIGDVLPEKPAVEISGPVGEKYLEWIRTNADQAGAWQGREWDGSPG